MPRLTVGLPLRNSSRYLREAIESVQRQSFRDWVLLAIDDSSRDATRSIVRDLASRDERIVLMEYDDEPTSQARNWNRVIEVATTELVSMFGHDDVMMPELLERQIRMLDRNPAMTFCFAQGPFIDPSGRVVRNKRDHVIMHPRWATDRIWERGTFGPELVVEAFVHPSSVMMRASVARGIELFPEDMPLYLDIDYWSRLGDCGTVGYVAGDLLRYRLNPEGAFERCMKTGVNLTDTDKLFRRLIAHRKWGGAEQDAFRKRFYQAHALRAFRAAERARKRSDTPTARLQFAICLAHGRSAGDDVHDWIARWWNETLLARRFSSPARRRLLASLASAPVVGSVLEKLYLSRLPKDEGGG